jgi:protein-S-isoprenylcysteine O-methyltransferase Ste14
MIYNIIFLIIWFAFSLIRVPHSKVYKKMEKEKSLRPRLEVFLVLLNFFGMVLLPVASIVLSFFNFDFFNSFIITLPDWMIISSLIILALSLIIFYVVHKELGKNWSPVLEIRKDHTLIKTGIYKRIRHPMYLQMWIWVIFQGITLQNWFVEAFGIAAWAVLYFIRVGAEEKMLIEKFGKEYKLYTKNSGRLFPKI